MDYLYQEFDPIVAQYAPVRVLEVGCGNCINIVNLKKKYNGKIDLYGIDISDERLRVSKQYFGNALDEVQLRNAPITEPLDWSDGFFDVVFSMHCLEQIPYQTQSALREIYRLTKRRMVMIEPIFELGNHVQRLYLLNSDHNRILLKSIKQLGYQIWRLESLDIQSNPLNQSSIVVIDKAHDIKSHQVASPTLSKAEPAET